MRPLPAGVMSCGCNRPSVEFRHFDEPGCYGSVIVVCLYCEVTSGFHPYRTPDQADLTISRAVASFNNAVKKMQGKPAYRLPYAWRQSDLFNQPVEVSNVPNA